MRRFLLAAVMFGAAAGAQAADLSDLPILRGAFTDGLTTTKVNWQGYYIGGQGSYGSSDMNFHRANDLLAIGLMAYSPLKSLTDVPSFGKSHSSNTGFGGFTGYGWQWEDVVVGVEASYIHGEFKGSAFPVPFRYTDAFGQPQIRSISTATVDMKDFGSLRLRAGYAVNCFLPYVFGGVAGGRADIDRSVSLLGNFDPLVTVNSHLKDHFMYGYSAGLGVDAMLFAGLFLRLEYEYHRFTSPVDININTLRAGVGYKF
jgi:outer membrane immunogenic protein